MASTAERILVVESDPDISEIIARQALKPLGYDVAILTGAAEAITAALADPPDLIIANLNLPDLGGKDVLAALSAKGVTAPLVVIAERGEERGAIQAFRLGAADAILWPARDAEIVRVVERSLQPTRSRRVRRQLYQQLEAAQEELKQRGGQLEPILSMSRLLAGRPPESTLLQLLLKGSLTLAEAQIAWVTVRDERSRTFLLRAQANLPSAWAKRMNHVLDDGFSPLVVRSGQRLAIHGSALEKFKASSLGKSAVVVPVKLQKDVLGVVAVVRKADVETDAHTQVIMQGLADMAAVGLLHSQLFRSLESAAAGRRRASSNRARVMQSLNSALEHLQQIRSGVEQEWTRPQKEALSALRVSIEQVARSMDKED